MSGTGVIIMGSDERRQIVGLRPLRANFYRRAVPGYEQSKKLRDVIGVYLGFGRWHVWVYFRERHLDGSTYASGPWITVVDRQRDNEISEAAA